MRRLFLPVALLLSAGPSVYPAEEAAAPRTSAFVRDGVRYEIQAVAHEATLCRGMLGQLVLFTVRRDGKFVHPARKDGGRLLGCTYSSQDTSRYLLEPFPDAEAPVGWVVGVGAYCGNTSSLEVTLVTLDFPRGDPAWSPAQYAETTFVSKTAPVYRRTPGGVEAWSSWQFWGAGGTSSSTFIPEKRLVRGDGSVRTCALDPDWTTWPPGFAQPALPQAYVAGLSQSNPELMRQAVYRLLEKDSGEWCERLGLPRDRDGLLETAKAVEDMAKARAEISRQTDLRFGDPPPAACETAGVPDAR